MGWNDPDVYHQPESFGLETVGSIEWSDASYSFDLTVVLRDPATGQLYTASDSGCSCPSPFEDYTSRDQLTEVSGWPGLDAHLRERLARERQQEADWGYRSSEAPAYEELEGHIGELVQKVQALR